MIDDQGLHWTVTTLCLHSYCLIKTTLRTRFNPLFARKSYASGVSFGSLIDATVEEHLTDVDIFFNFFFVFNQIGFKFLANHSQR